MARGLGASSWRVTAWVPVLLWEACPTELPHASLIRARTPYFQTTQGHLLVKLAAPVLTWGHSYVTAETAGVRGGPTGCSSLGGQQSEATGGAGSEQSMTGRPGEELASGKVCWLGSSVEVRGSATWQRGRCEITASVSQKLEESGVHAEGAERLESEGRVRKAGWEDLGRETWGDDCSAGQSTPDGAARGQVWKIHSWQKRSVRERRRPPHSTSAVLDGCSWRRPRSRLRVPAWQDRPQPGRLVPCPIRSQVDAVIVATVEAGVDVNTGQPPELRRWLGTQQSGRGGSRGEWVDRQSGPCLHHQKKSRALRVVPLLQSQDLSQD